MRTAIQPSLFPEFDSIAMELDALASAPPEERGAIFTKPEVVRFILDLIGYTQKKQLYRRRILEPSFGHGSFLFEIVDRLLASFARTGDPTNPGPEEITLLSASIRAVELHHESFASMRPKIAKRLRAAGFERNVAQRLVDTWLVQGDFLFSDLGDKPFDFVAGNPPYLRQEMIPNALLEEYRKQFATMYDRADLYVAFFERSLGLLGKDGALGFICADRWTKNKYGGPLREMVARGFHLAHYVPMTGLDAFDSEVSAYPAVAIIRKAERGETRIAKPGGIDELADLAKRMKRAELNGNGTVQTLQAVAQGSAPWILTTDPRTRLVQALEARCPTLEESGCKVGIGVATGADKIYIQDFDAFDVEPSRKLPLAITRDLKEHGIEWSGKGVLNPFQEDGSLAPLDQFPKMAAYLAEHEAVIKGRNVARKNPRNWYRTIDRIYPSLAAAPKLLVPDIRGAASIVHENHGLYPHHNFYYIVAEKWDLRVLQGILLSGLARLFVAAYTTRMRGGYLRYQAQYLRRIRLPELDSLSGSQIDDLRRAAESSDWAACHEITADMLNLAAAEKSALEGAR